MWMAERKPLKDLVKRVVAWAAGRLRMPRVGRDRFMYRRDR